MIDVNNNYICMFYHSKAIDDVCRNCDGKNNLCEDYVPQVQQVIRKNQEQIERTNRILEPMMLRYPRHSKILPRNYQDWIRRGNDGGAI